jgi:hypothetical protein
MTPLHVAIVGILALAACRPAIDRPEEAAMSLLYEVRHITASIHRSPADVYAFASNGENLPRWASGLGASIHPEQGEWVAEGPLGRVRVRMAPPNPFGVLDQDVTLPSGETVHNPLRVVPNSSGSTVIFTLLRLPGMSAQKFEEDAAWVQKDLATLKTLMESSSGPSAAR